MSNADLSAVETRTSLAKPAGTAPFSGIRESSPRYIPLTNLEACRSSALLLDAALIVLASVISGIGYHLAWFKRVGDISDFVTTGAFVALTFGIFIRLGTAGAPTLPSSTFIRARGAFFAWLKSFGLLLLMLFTFKEAAAVSRGTIGIFFLFGLPLVLVSRINVPLLMARLQRDSSFHGREAIVVSATGMPGIHDFSQDLRRRLAVSPNVVSFDAQCDGVKWAAERKLLIEQLCNLARVMGEGDIYLCAAGIPAERLQGILSSLAVIPRAITVVPDSAMSDLLRGGLTLIGGKPAIVYQSAPVSASDRFAKRIMDVTLSGMAILFLLPLLALVALSVKMESKGPILFCQRRNGLGGRTFKIMKFRSMSVMEDGAQVVQAKEGDTRVTRVGAFLRRTSLDELPQFFNVFLGDMSLVGPRPHALAHDEMYRALIDNYEVRQHVKPGITGWAQVNGLRGPTPTLDTMYRRVEHDIWYALNSSPILDLEILGRTVIEVLRQRNAV